MRVDAKFRYRVTLKGGHAEFPTLKKAKAFVRATDSRYVVMVTRRRLPEKFPEYTYSVRDIYLESD